MSSCLYSAIASTRTRAYPYPLIKTMRDVIGQVDQLRCCTSVGSASMLESNRQRASLQRLCAVTHHVQGELECKECGLRPRHSWASTKSVNNGTRRSVAQSTWRPHGNNTTCYCGNWWQPDGRMQIATRLCTVAVHCCRLIRAKLQSRTSCGCSSLGVQAMKRAQVVQSPRSPCAQHSRPCISIRGFPVWQRPRCA